MATQRTGAAPRAMIHKRILDSARSDPEASLEDLAEDVAGASPDLVERVLEEYGDPGEPTNADETDSGDSMPEQADITDVAELTEKQRETIRAIADRPDATQAELAEALGVSRATVNKRLNDIDGFDWAERTSFVESVLATEPAAGATAPPVADAASDGGQLLAADAEHAVEQLQERVARLEQQVDRSVESEATGLEDTELLTKVVRAVMAAEDVTEDEEVRILEALR